LPACGGTHQEALAGHLLETSRAPCRCSAGSAASTAWPWSPT